MFSPKDFARVSYSVGFLLEAQSQEIMEIALFLYYKVCQVFSLFSEVVPDLKRGFNNLAVLIAFLLQNLNIQHFVFDWRTTFCSQEKIL